MDSPQDPESNALSHPPTPTSEAVYTDPPVTTTSSSTTEAAIHSSKETALHFLRGLLGSTLHLYTSDGRMFAGEFKCTDKDRNIILARAYECRMPATALATAAAADTAGTASAGDKVVVDMTSRFMGLIVVPGQHITKIEIGER